MITDAQVHLYRPDSPENPWPKDPWRPTPAIKSYTAEQMVAAMDAVGVDRAVIVPPIWESDEQETAFKACRDHPGRFKIMGRLDPYGPKAKEMLETWLQKPDMLGIRLAFVRWGASGILLKEALPDPSIAWFWGACERLGIPLMVFPQEQPARLAPIAERHPNLKLIVDHIASVAGDTVAASYVAIDDLCALAKYPHVYVKVSDAPNRSKQKYPFEDVHYIIRKLYDSFGPRRMMWGVDITQLPKGVPYWHALRLWQEGVPFLTAEDRDWILGRTCAEVLKWPEK
jgi:predicted TIM-barrel fold metal-dependent hydrolase